MATTRRFRVTGMSCDGCERALGRAVGKLPGVQSVVASHVEEAATVTFDEAVVTAETITTTIRHAGYTPEPTPPA